MERKTCLIPPSKAVLFLLIHAIVRLDAHKLSLLIFLLSSPLLLRRILATGAMSFDYPDFRNHSGICLQGNVSLEGTGAIQLDDENFNKSVGLAYYCEPIPLWNATTGELSNFTTTFTFGVSHIWTNLFFFLLTLRQPLGGGVTFFLSEDPTIPPHGRGDYLGLINGPSLLASESRRFVAIEFDSRNNSWDPPDSFGHVGIDVNSLESVAIATMVGNSFAPGPQGKAHVAYNSISKNLSVSLDYNHTLYELSYVVDLRTHLPQSVYVGFSLATDFSGDVKNITSWSFQYSNLDAPKEPPPLSPPVAPPEFEVNNTIKNYTKIQPSTKKKSGVLVAAIAVPVLITVLVAGVLCFFLCAFKRAKCKDKVVGEVNNISSAPQNQGPSNFPAAYGSIEECRLDDSPLRRERDCRRNAHLHEKFDDEGPRRIPFYHLVAATDNFHQNRRLGKGASGEVYYGFLKELKQEVAIKRIKEYSEHGEKEFAAEVKTIRRSRHRNLLKLIGYCREGRELLLVYDFMPNGSLDCHLFDSGDNVLSWSRRRNIALGLASALQYLHEELDECIVHRDIKPSNIMLDSEFNAKLGDFGLARATNHGSPFQWTTMAGTIGYMAPEYYITGKSSKETDVYSFGIVALELTSGRRATEPEEKGREILIHWIWDLYAKGGMVDAVDKKLRANFDEREAERLMMVGLWCAHPEARSRPSFRQVISSLNFEIPVPDLNISTSSITQLPYVLASHDSSAATT